MERAVYERMAEIDRVHWWYTARREILADLVAQRIPLPSDARILEIGCGTGHNLEMLARFGRVEAIELDAEARALASERLGRPVGSATLPGLDGVAEGSFDLIALLDVLEHVEEDLASLRSIARRLGKDGRVLLTVPAHPWMWSAHDEVNHHVRRYTKRAFRALLEEAGLKIELLSYFNSVLFPAAVVARFAGRLSGKDDGDDRLPPRIVNRLFERLFALERHALGKLPFPPGLSLVAIASRPPSS